MVKSLVVRTLEEVSELSRGRLNVGVGMSIVKLGNVDNDLDREYEELRKQEE